jgi:Arm DNA-binding domain
MVFCYPWRYPGGDCGQGAHRRSRRKNQGRRGAARNSRRANSRALSRCPGERQKELGRAYRFGGKPCKLTLGQYPAIDLKTARMRAGDAKNKVAEGINPGLIRKAQQAARSIVANDLVEAVAERFLAQYAQRNLKPSTCPDVKRILNRTVVPAWKGRRRGNPLPGRS